MPRAQISRSSRLESRAREIVEALGGHWGRGRGMCCCPAHDDRTPSLAIGLGAHAILFHCFAGCSSAAVLEGLARHGIKARELFEGGGAPVVPVIKDTGPDRNALRLWRDAVPLTGTIAERYLAGRFIAAVSQELRFHAATPLGSRPNVRMLPALLAAVRMDGGIVAVQRTFLDPVSGTKAQFTKPKRALGRLGSGAVRLVPPRDGILGLAEGVESALSAKTLHNVPCWATLGNERFGLVAIPDSVTELHLFIDADAGGELALARGLEAYARPGRRIIPHRPVVEGDDWNDMLVGLRSRKAA
jgi:putative DNA primase/helicase